MVEIKNKRKTKKKKQQVKGIEPTLIYYGERGSGERDKLVEIMTLFRKTRKIILLSWKGIRRYNALGKIMNKTALMIGYIPGPNRCIFITGRVFSSSFGLHKQA